MVDYVSEVAIPAEEEARAEALYTTVYNDDDLAEWLIQSSQWWQGDCEKKMQAAAAIKRLRAALEEIRDIARASEGVEFYAMLAEKGLGDA